MRIATIREAVAAFDDPEKLESAVSELQSNGIDRSDLSFLAHPSLAERLPGNSMRLADDPAAPREAAVTDTDLRQGRVLGTSLAATIAALAAAGFTVTTGGVAAATVAAAAAAGSIGAVGAVVGRKLGEDQETFLESQLGTDARCRCRATRARGVTSPFVACTSPRLAGTTQTRAALRPPGLIRSQRLGDETHPAIRML